MMMPAARYMHEERWVVLDPKHRKHFIDRDYKGYAHTENLAWFVPEQDRAFIISGVLDKISADPEMGEWAGWVWLRL